MMYWRELIAVSISIFIPVIIASCNKLSEADKQRLFMAELGALGDADPVIQRPPSSLLPAEADKGAVIW